MYRKRHNGQLAIEDFHVPFGGTLDPDNLSGKLSARGAELSTVIERTAGQGSGAARLDRRHHLDTGLWLRMELPAPDRDCCRWRPWRGAIGQPRGPGLLRVKQLQVAAGGDG
jgi:hypothetical protein